MTRPRAQTIPHPWPIDLPPRFDLIKATVLARGTYGRSVSEMLDALAGLGIGVEVYRKPVVPGAADGIWFTRVILHWARAGQSPNGGDSMDLHLDLTDPVGQKASPEAAAMIEDLAICAALDRLLSDYDDSCF